MVALGLLYAVVILSVLDSRYLFKLLLELDLLKFLLLNQLVLILLLHLRSLEDVLFELNHVMVLLLLSLKHELLADAVCQAGHGR